MKTNKLEKFESKIEPETSLERIEQSKQEFVNLLTPMIEKLLRSPETIRAVKESFSELAEQARSGIVRQSTIIQTETNPDRNLITKIDTGNDTDELLQNGSDLLLKFDKHELELLEQIKNAS